MQSSIDQAPPRTAKKRSRVPLLIAALVVAGLAEMVGCDDGGGGGSSGASAPQLPWPRVRRSDLNGGIGSGGIDDNEAQVTDYFSFRSEGMPATYTPSGAVPIIGRNRAVYVAAEQGLLSIDSDFVQRWFVDDEQCTGDEPFANLFSPTISTDGREIIIASANPEEENGGNIFRLNEPESGDDPPEECGVIFNVGSTSSALTQVDGFDLRLLSFVTGTVAGRLTSIGENGDRRWSYPEGPALAGDLSSPPTTSNGNFILVSPDGRLHSVGPSGQPRWISNIGGAYPDDQPIPAPAVFREIFTVSAEGDVVAFSSRGDRLWTFSPEDGARIVGSLSVSSLAAEDGGLIGQNVVFAVDENATVYGIGTEDGELVNFCQTDNRACAPSTCTDEGSCLEQNRCEDSLDPCASEADCDEGEECNTGFFCGEPIEGRQCPNRTYEECCEGEETPEGREDCVDNKTLACTEDFECVPRNDVRCVRDLCIEDDEEDSDGLCRREAKYSMAPSGSEIFGSIAVSTDSMVTAVTKDGRLCVRGLDGSIPDGRCSRTNAICAPDSCGLGDRCCVNPADCCPDGETQCDALGRCINAPERACSADSCEEDDEGSCETIWLNTLCFDSLEPCAQDSCGPGDQCCVDPENQDCSEDDIGRCIGNSSLPCAPDSCDDGEGPCVLLNGAEADDAGCIEFENFAISDELDDALPDGIEVGTAPAAAPVIDSGGTILIMTDKGIARIE